MAEYSVSQFGSTSSPEHHEVCRVYAWFATLRSPQTSPSGSSGLKLETELKMRSRGALGTTQVKTELKNSQRVDIFHFKPPRELIFNSIPNFGPEELL